MNKNARNLLNHLEQSWVVESIREAEEKTTGEIKVHLEDYCLVPVKDRAAEVFAALGMHETQARNGVLIYIAALDHEFAILGDVAINERVDESFWLDMAQTLHADFHKNDHYEGISKVVHKVGDVLKKEFPSDHGRPNEISDELSFT